MSVFRSYDIRGIYGKEINNEFAYNLGRALVLYLDAKNVVVGRDARDNAPTVARHLIRGLTDQGANVVDAGMVTTPMLYYLSAKKDDFDGAIMVSASHNPPKYTGFKLCGKNADFINKKKGSLEVRDLMEKGDFGNPEKGSVTEKDYYDEYVEFIADAADTDLSGLKIVIDTSNGCVGPMMEKLIERLNLDAKKMYFEPDGNFPNHPPNPLLPESQEEIKKELEKGDYDLGILLDADGDRTIFLDEKGNTVRSASILIALAKHYYDKGETFAFDVLNYRTSVLKTLRKIGGEAYPSEVGYAHVKDALLEHNGVLGCEFSGHFQHKEAGYCDNAALVMVKVLTSLVKTGMKLSEMVEETEKNALLQVNVEVEGKDEKIQMVDEAFPDAETLRIDGVSKTFDDYWFNVRKSNTEPLLRITIEADSEEIVEEILKEIKEIIGVEEEGERY